METLLIGPGESRGAKAGQRAGGGSAQFSRHLVWSRGCVRGRGGCAAGAAGSAVGPGLGRWRRSVSAGGAQDGPGAAAGPPVRAGLRFGCALPSRLVLGRAEERAVAVAAMLP